MNPEGNHDKFPTKEDGSRDIIRDHNHVDTWKQMEKLLGTGKVKAIGVSNVSFPPPPLPMSGAALMRTCRTTVQQALP